MLSFIKIKNINELFYIVILFLYLCGQLKESLLVLSSIKQQPVYHSRPLNGILMKKVNKQYGTYNSTK